MKNTYLQVIHYNFKNNKLKQKTKQQGYVRGFEGKEMKRKWHNHIKTCKNIKHNLKKET